MRIRPFVISLGLSSIATTMPALAEHDPVLEETVVTPSGVGFVGLGWTAGSTDGQAISAVQVDAGVHLRGRLWAHGRIDNGGVVTLFGRGDFTRATGGVELRDCSVASLCALIGIDAGYQHVFLETSPLFGDGDPKVEIDATELVVDLRVGIDIGSEHARFRPELGFPFVPGQTDHSLGFELALGAVLQF